MHVVLGTLGELDNAIGEGEQRVILAATDVLARRDVRATLTDDDLAGLDGLATINLGAEALGVGIATVARGAETLLMSTTNYCTLYCNGNN